MKYNFDSIITFKKDEPFDVNYINNVCRQYPQKRFLIEVQNTKGLKSSELRKLDPNVSIRIAGSFDEERCKNGHFTERFDCGHGIHVDQPKQFVKALIRK